MTDYISRADAIDAKPEYRNEDMWDKEKSTYNKGWNDCNDAWVAIIKALPSADAVSREEYEETDGVVKIEKQNANEVGEIKHIVIHSPNYTRYFYNESMPTSADAEPIVYCMDCAKSAPLDEHGALWYCKAHDRTTLRHSYCNNGERKGGDDE